MIYELFIINKVGKKRFLGQSAETSKTKQIIKKFYYTLKIKEEMVSNEESLYQEEVKTMRFTE